MRARAPEMIALRKATWRAKMPATGQEREPDERSGRRKQEASRRHLADELKTSRMKKPLIIPRCRRKEAGRSMRALGRTGAGIHAILSPAGGAQ